MTEEHHSFSCCQGPGEDGADPAPGLGSGGALSRHWDLRTQRSLGTKPGARHRVGVGMVGPRLKAWVHGTALKPHGGCLQLADVG